MNPQPSKNPSDGNGHRKGGRLDFGDYDKSPADLQNDIRQTRSRFDDHLDQLADHLHPKALMHDLGDAVRGGGSALSKTLVRNVSRYPLPSALIGAGVAWLLMSRSEHNTPAPGTRSTMSRPASSNPPGAPGDIYYQDDRDSDLYAGSEMEEDYPQLSSDELAVLGTVYPEYGSYHELESESARYDDDDTSESAMSYRQRLESARVKARDAAGHAAERAKDGGSSVIHTVKKASRRVNNLAHTAGRRVKRAASATSHGIQQGYGSAGHGLHRAADMGSSALHGVGAIGSQAAHGIAQGSRQLKSSVSHGYERTAETVRETADRAPLATGLACLAAGIVAGLLIPSTRREDEAFGATADDLKERATETARDAAHRAKHAAQATANAAMESAKEEGLTPAALREHAGHVAGAAREAVTDSVRSGADAVKADAEDEGLTPGGLKEKVSHVVRHTAEVAKEEFSREAGESDAARQAGRADRATS